MGTFKDILNDTFCSQCNKSSLRLCSKVFCIKKSKIKHEHIEFDNTFGYKTAKKLPKVFCIKKVIMSILNLTILLSTRQLKNCPVITYFWWYLALDVTVNCICEIHCLALEGFDLNTVHKLCSKEKNSRREKSRWSRDLNPGLLGGKHLCATQPPVFTDLQKQTCITFTALPTVGARALFYN